jgi:nucleotide-binding universal stress UspA family protein
MLSTVLVPLDGSRFAEAALPIATRLASFAGARLYLTTANQPMGALVGMGEMGLFQPGPDDEMRRQGMEYLAEVAAKCDQPGNWPVEFRLIEGPVGEAVCDEAGRIGADLIVMATHGRGALGRLWLGSVADHVVRHSTRPVLLVHPGRDGVPSLNHDGRAILVALDQSEYSDAILDPVVDLAQVTGAGVTLLTVVAPTFDAAEPTMPFPVPQHPAICARRSDEAHCRLRRVAARLRRRGVSVSRRVVVGDSAAGGILSVLGEPRFDMVALTTHGAMGVRRLIVGSVAEKVIRAAEKPVLVLHPAAFRPSGSAGEP